MSETFGGLTLAGGKRQGTALALLRHEEKTNQLFLTDLYGKLGSTPSKTSDQALLHVIQKRGDPPSILGVNVPLALPPCLLCQLPWCPGHEACEVESVVWMRKSQTRMTKKYKHSKPPLPYVQRPVEVYLRENISHELDLPGAYSSNISPLVARIQYLKRHLSQSIQLIEILPRLTFYQLAPMFGLDAKLAFTYRGPEKGSEDRYRFLSRLKEHVPLFIYDRDLELLTLNPPCFDAFLGAYTAFLFKQGLCENPPENFPLDEGWVAFPKMSG